jgi:hypothetical protein
MNLIYYLQHDIVNQLKSTQKCLEDLKAQGDLESLKEQIRSLKRSISLETEKHSSELANAGEYVSATLFSFSVS